MPANECIDYYKPGKDLTGKASAAVTGKRFVKISGNRAGDAGAGLTADVLGGTVTIAPADAAGRIAGVARHDAATGEFVGVARGSGRVVPVQCSANIAAFAEVEVSTAGQCVTLTSGVAVGYAITAATSGSDAQISLY